MKRPTAAYTLIEVIVAAAILMIAVGAAAALALATVTQEETNGRIIRCLNLHEQAVRLYQLGLDPSVVSAVLPVDPAVVDLIFTTENLLISDLGTVEQAGSTLTFLTSDAGAERTSSITAIRPSIR